MVNVIRITIFPQKYKPFSIISQRLTEYFANQGGTVLGTPRSDDDALHLKVHFEPEKIPHKPTDEKKQQLFYQIYSSEFDIALCKHGFFVIGVQNLQLKELTSEIREFLLDITSRLESEIKLRKTLREFPVTNEKSSISFDTGILYSDEDMKEALITHLTKIEDRYSNILLMDLYGQFVINKDVGRNYYFARSLGDYRQAISDYVNKLSESPRRCKLANIDRDEVMEPILFLQKLCDHLNEQFDKFLQKKPRNQKKTNEELTKIFNTDIQDLIKMNESQYLEIKSTMKFDLYQQKPTDIPEQEVVKTIAGFMNSYDGGVLLVGYDQRSKKTIGLEKDFPHTGKTKDWDSWLLFFMSKFNESIGRKNSHYIEVQPVKHDGFTLAKILVHPSNRAIYVNNEFYRRSHGLTDKLSGQDLQDYIDDRFG